MRSVIVIQDTNASDGSSSLNFVRVSLFSYFTIALSFNNIWLVGAGVSFGKNAQNALAKLGLKKAFEEQGLDVGLLEDKNKAVLLETDIASHTLGFWRERLAELHDNVTCIIHNGMEFIFGI